MKKALKPVTESALSHRPTHFRLLREEHANDEIITIESHSFNELHPNWNGSVFNPNFVNASTGKLFAKTDHDNRKGVEKTWRAFVRLEFAFCLKWVLNIIDGKPVWDHCYNSRPRLHTENKVNSD